MKLRPKTPPAKSSQTLIVTLAILVVVTIAIASTLALVELDSQTTKNSSEQTQSSLMALNAVSLIEGDLKQEIINGSTSITLPSNATYQLYYPTAATNMTVVRNTTSNAQTNIVNLIRGSYRNDPISLPGVSSMASAVNSSTDPSYDGRVVNLASWNAHYLIPRLNAGSSTPPASMDSTPIAAFAAPDWVYVSGAGNREVISTPDKTVVGRYAYTIYDEGGLLDANVVGTPSTMTAAAKAQKNSAAFADLTQLPYLGQTNIDNLVGWRNYYTVQPSGSFPNYTISSSSATNYFNYLNNATNGFLVVNPAPAKATVTDQSFPSRQALISYCRSSGISVDALQYLGTHSRDLNQPSYVPPPNRPTVVSPGSKVGLSWNPATYRGGNDGYTGDNTINPPLLAITAQSAFTRNDGSTAVIGEPLVKKRFDLRRLAWLTYQGPSASRNLGDPDMVQVLANGVTTSFLQQGTSSNIKAYFGLTWNGTNWVYAPTNPAPNNRIGTLADVQTLNRDANFFELLKAAINVGSIGKSSASGVGNSTDAGYYQHQIDISVDNQIIQIGANMIDQSDADGCPTDISFNGLDIYGVKNLPFLYRTTYSWAKKADTTPLIPSTAYGIYDITASPGYMTAAGEADFYIVPHIWNMCDQNDITLRGANYALGNPRPGQLSISATGAPPGTSTSTWNAGFKMLGIYDQSNATPPRKPTDPVPSTPPALPMWFVSLSAAPLSLTLSAYTPNSLNGATLTFTDYNGLLFREPTMLWKLGYPSNSNLTTNQPNSTQVTDLFDNTVRTGFYLGSAPLGWTYVDGGKTFFTQARGLDMILSGTGYGYKGAVNYQFQYLNPASGKWQTYDQRYWDEQAREPDNGASLSGTYKAIDEVFSGGWISYQYANLAPSGTPPNIDPTTTGAYEGDDCIGFDCRSDRWGFGIGNASSVLELDYPSLKSPQFSVNQTERPGASPKNGQNDGQSGTHNALWQPGSACLGTYNALFYDSPSYIWTGSLTNTGQWGMWSQNSPWVVNTTTGSPSAQYHLFNADADGVVRRAMGAYVTSTTSATGLPLATATSFSNGVGTVIPAQSSSRPIILNRPFQSINELNYVFKGTPYKNLDFSTPESGDSALLDVFCVGDVSASNGLEAGKVNLNTRQLPVLKALLNNTDIDDPAFATAFSPTEVTNLANSLYSRTSNTTTPWLGPLMNVSDLAGKYVGKNVAGTSATAPHLAPLGGNSYYAVNIESAGTAWGSSGNTVCYSGYSADLDSDFSSSSTALIERKRQSAIRALATGGQVRVWNLLIDIDAQTGVFPPAAATAAQFTVQGESHYWVHVAIDRYTGQVIDSQSELVQQ